MCVLNRIRHLFGWLVVLLAFQASAQIPYLERPVTVKYATLTYADLFKSLSNQTGVTFSYTNFNDHQKVTVQYAKKPLRVVLNDLFDDNGCTYKLKGKYVILTCKGKPKPSSDIRLNGYIYDAADSSLVASSSVYLRQNRQSAVTNDFGYFSINFPKTSDILSISVAKEDYRDTTIVILSKAQQTIVIYLQPEQQTVIDIDSSDIIVTVETGKPAVLPVEELQADSLEADNFPFGRLGKTNTNRRNIRDTLFTNFAVGLIPQISTNRLLSINTVNNYSLNLLAGYSKGINVLEIGGLVNLDNGNVRWVQIGGISNLVSGNVSGFQAGGILNYVGKDVNGFQVGGIANIVRGKMNYAQVGGIGNVVSDTVSGFQAGGIFNTNLKHTDGFQVAGIYNQSPTVSGGQISGIANQVHRDMDGFQIAGIANNAWTMNGFQIGGIVNRVHTINGFQLAGIANNADSIDGFQFSGIVNIARHVNGSQLSLINITGSVTGVPVGLLSYVHNGYHKIELAADEQLMTTFGFRTGVNALHNIFFAGIQPSGSQKRWTYGYGLGTAIRMNDKLFLGIDLTGQQVQFAETPETRMNIVSKLYLGLEWRIAPKFSIAAGPTVNMLTSDASASDFQQIRDSFGEKPLYSETSGDVYSKLWIGARVSLKVF